MDTEFLIKVFITNLGWLEIYLFLKWSLQKQKLSRKITEP